VDHIVRLPLQLDVVQITTPDVKIEPGIRKALAKPTQILGIHVDDDNA
jgi:hypothetical protein